MRGCRVLDNFIPNEIRHNDMKAIEFDKHGPPEVLTLVEKALPLPGPGQVQLRVAAAGVNPADYKWRNGFNLRYMPLPLPYIPGYDVAGEITAIGKDVTGFAVGNRIVATVMSGYAEFAVANADHCALLPANVDFVQAAALPTAALTGVEMVEEGIAPADGQTVLVTGATGGVGRFAARAAQLLGARVIVAVRDDYAEEARGLGFKEVIGFKSSISDSQRFDHVADTVGGPDVARLCRNVVPGGKIITVATTPIDAQGLPATPQMFGYHGDGKRLARIVKDVASGAITMPVARTFPLTAAPDAHRLLEAAGIRGRVVLLP